MTATRLRASGLPVRSVDCVLMAGTVALVLALLLTTHDADWRGSWGETGAAIESGTTLAYPLAGALAAWLFAAPRRRRFQWMLDSSSRQRAWLYVSTHLVLTASAVVAHVLVTTVAFLFTAKEATFGGPPVLSVVAVAAGFFAAVAVGLLAGRLLPGYVAPAATVVTIYLVEYLVMSGHLPFAAALSVADGRERTYRETLEWVLLARAGWLIAFGLLLAAVAVRHSRLFFAAMTATCLLATPLLLTGASGVVMDPSAQKPVCSEFASDLTICMTAARGHTMPAVADGIRPELDLISGLSPAGFLLVEDQLGSDSVGEHLGPLRVPFHVSNGVNGEAHQVRSLELQLQVADTLLQTNCKHPETASTHPPATAGDVVEHWLLSQLGIPTDGSAALGARPLDPAAIDYAPVARFREAWDGASSTQRDQLMSTYRGEILACVLPADLR